MNSRQTATGRLARITKDLSPEQGELLTRWFRYLEPSTSHQGNSREGWSILRSPTTGNNPTTLRLRKRNLDGTLIREISITENGVNLPGPGDNPGG